MFFFRWEPGTSTILRARAHRPDVCLPNTGWRVAEDLGVSDYTVANGVRMPFRHFSFVRDGNDRRLVSAHAFFCQREDRVSAAAGQYNMNTGSTGNWGMADRVRAVREGQRNQGQQVLEVVMITPREMPSTAVQGEFAKLAPQIVVVGARP